MTTAILHDYMKVLYYINNRIKHKYSKYSTHSPYIQHRIGMDLEIVKRNIVREMSSLAITTNTKLPTLKSIGKQNSLAQLVQDVNNIIGNTNFSPNYLHPSSYNTHYALLRYRELRHHSLFQLPYIRYTQLTQYLQKR